MHFVITGGAGFIGSNLAERLLKQMHAVTVIDDLNDFYDPSFKRRNIDELKLASPNIDFYNASITDPASLDGILARHPVDQIIHLAARAGVRPSLEDPALYMRVNVEGTVNVLEAARRRGIRKITIASSSSVYGINSKLPFSEKDPIFQAISPYAASKLACEAIGHAYHHLYGMDIAMLRFFTVYGPRQRPDLAIYKFAGLLLKGVELPVFGDGTTARDYTYVDDIVDGIVACTERELGYEIFNLGDSRTVTLKKMISVLEEVFEKKAILRHHPMQPGDVPITYADISKAGERLGYSPKVPFEEGMKRFAEWYRKTHRV